MISPALTVLAIWHASDDGIVTLDASGAIRAANGAWLQTMDVATESDIVGRHWPDLWSADSPAASAVLRACDNLPTRFSASCKSFTGRIVWFDVLVAPIPPGDLDSPGIAVRSLDLTHCKQAEIDLRRQLDEKEAALGVLMGQLENQAMRISSATARAAHSEKLRMMGQFVGNIVHDINSVLAVVSGAARLLRRSEGRETQAQIIEHVDKAIDRGTLLVRQLLNLSRVEGSEPDILSVAEFARDNAELLRHLLSSSITLNLEIDPECWPVLVNQARLQAVILNLSANARDAMAHGGTLTLAAGNCYSVERPPVLPPGDYVQFALRDNGAGMPPEILARAGEAFFTTKGPERGTGLGLASAFELAAQCSGRVIVSSAVGIGTTVSMYLPRAAADGTPVGALDDAIDPNLHGGATILLIENEEMIRAHLASTLRSLNYRVIEAWEQGVAFALLSSGTKIDLACIDLQLDQGSGPELAAELRKKWPLLPVIFMTGSSSIAIPRDDLVFRKPISEPVFARAILEKLNRLPVSIMTPETLRLSDRVRDRIRDEAVRHTFDVWRSLCVQRGHLPNSDFVAQIAADVMQNSCVLEIQLIEGEPGFRVAFAGEALSKRLGRALVGETIASSDGDLFGPMAGAYGRASKGVAHFDYARFRLADHTTLIFERLTLPLSDQPGHVTHVFGVIKFTEIGDGHD